MNWLTKLFQKRKNVVATNSHSESENKTPSEKNNSTAKIENEIEQNSELKKQDKDTDAVEQTIYDLSCASVWHEKKNWQKN